MSGSDLAHPVLRIKGLNVAPESLANLIRQSTRLDHKTEGRRGPNVNRSLNRLTINIPIGDHQLVIPAPDNLRDQQEQMHAGGGVGMKVAPINGQNIHVSSSRVSAQVSPASDAVQETLVDSSPIVDAFYPQASAVGATRVGGAL